MPGYKEGSYHNQQHSTGYFDGVQMPPEAAVKGEKPVYPKRCKQEWDG